MPKLPRGLRRCKQCRKAWKNCKCGGERGCLPRKPRRDENILMIGRQMSNVLFNLSQRGDGSSNNHVAANEYACFKELQQQWDNAVIEYRASFGRRRGATPKETDAK